MKATETIRPARRAGRILSVPCSALFAAAIAGGSWAALPAAAEFPAPSVIRIQSMGAESGTERPDAQAAFGRQSPISGRNAARRATRSYRSIMVSRFQLNGEPIEDDKKPVARLRLPASFASIEPRYSTSPRQSGRPTPTTLWLRSVVDESSVASTVLHVETATMVPPAPNDPSRHRLRDRDSMVTILRCIHLSPVRDVRAGR